jgi:hydroxymethylpyrimidine pyrophosphatase-like HAD family hydrolase
MEISRRRDQGGALTDLCERLGVAAEDVVAFGDCRTTWRCDVTGSSAAVANGRESVLVAAAMSRRATPGTALRSRSPGFSGCDAMVR